MRSMPGGRMPILGHRTFRSAHRFSFLFKKAPVGITFFCHVSWWVRARRKHAHYEAVHCARTTSLGGCAHVGSMLTTDIRPYSCQSIDLRPFLGRCPRRLAGARAIDECPISSFLPTAFPTLASRRGGVGSRLFVRAEGARHLFPTPQPHLSDVSLARQKARRIPR